MALENKLRGLNERTAEATSTDRREDVISAVSKEEVAETSSPSCPFVKLVVLCLLEVEALGVKIRNLKEFGKDIIQAKASI